MKIILVVEDEEALQQSLSEVLTDKHYKVICAINGVEGLTQALKYHPDLILLDILMPVMDGLSMLQKLRQDKWGKFVKVMLLTNLKDQEKIAEAIEEEATSYFIKTDWSLEDLVAKIAETLRD